MYIWDVIENESNKMSKSKAEYQVEMAEFVSKFPDCCQKLKKSPIAMFRGLILEANEPG